MVQHRAERVLSVVPRRGGFHGIRDGDPEEPGESRSCSRISRPVAVSLLRLATHSTPDVSIKARRYGFSANETLTMWTLMPRPTSARANESLSPTSQHSFPWRSLAHPFSWRSAPRTWPCRTLGTDGADALGHARYPHVWTAERGHGRVRAFGRTVLAVLRFRCRGCRPRSGRNAPQNRPAASSP